MQVLMVAHSYPLYPGDSTAPFVDAIARGVVCRGHDVTVLLPYHPQFGQPDGDGLRFLSYRYSPIRSVAPWGFGQTFGPTAGIRASTAAALPTVAISLYHALRRELRSGRYDLVHTHWIIPNGTFAAVAGRDRDVPLVVTMHGSDVAVAERHRALARVARWAFSKTDFVTATSSQLVERAVRLGAEPTRARTVYLGVDTERFSADAPSPGTRERLGAGTDDFLVVCVARLDEVKGVTYLIDAAAGLKNVVLAVVGDGALRGDLHAQARRLGARVTFTGNVPHARVAELLGAADAVAVPSIVDRTGRVDGTTSTVPEAMAAGKPIITTDVGGIPELAKHEVNALVVPQKDARALAAAIERLRSDRELSQRIARHAREFALRSLSWSANASEFEAIYAEAANRRRPTAL
jgi:glycosyltransferase involved in cell wall biosynthesis